MRLTGRPVHSHPAPPSESLWSQFDDMDYPAGHAFDTDGPQPKEVASEIAAGLRARLILRPDELPPEL